MNREALARTAELGEAVYWSRSRERLWHKGEESGHVQKVHEIRLDCDNDVVLLKVEQLGGEPASRRSPATPGATRASSSVYEDGALADGRSGLERSRSASTDEATTIAGNDTLARLAAVIEARRGGDPAKSYVARLFAKGADAVLKKIGEEATEVVMACKDGDREQDRRRGRRPVVPHHDRAGAASASRRPTCWPNWSAARACRASRSSRPARCSRETGEQEHMNDVDRRRPDAQQSLKTIGHISYFLHADRRRRRGAARRAGQRRCCSLVAFVLDMFKRDDARGTWQESHFSWRIRSVLWAGGALPGDRAALAAVHRPGLDRLGAHLDLVPVPRRPRLAEPVVEHADADAEPEARDAAHDPNCIFCKIVAGEIPSRKAYEDDEHPGLPRHRALGAGARAGDSEGAHRELLRRRPRPRGAARPHAGAGAAADARARRDERLSHPGQHRRRRAAGGASTSTCTSWAGRGRGPKG